MTEEARPPEQPAEPQPPAEPQATPEPPPPPDDFSSQPVITDPGVRRVLATSLDVLTAASAELRRASFYIGLVALGLLGPGLLLDWAVEVAFEQMGDREFTAVATESNLLSWIQIAGLMSSLGLVIVTLESRTVAGALIGARLTGRPITVRQALQRSRDIFWRALGVTILVNVPLLIVELMAVDRIAPAFGTGTEITVVSALLLTAVLFSPLTYALMGITLGDVGVRTALRRSVGLFRTRPILAVLVSVLGAMAQLLLLLALGAGLELLLGLAGVVGVGSDSDALGLAVGTAGVVVFTFAIGTLASTIAALAVAPQATGFVALTHVAPAIDRIRRIERRVVDPAWPFAPNEPHFRWLTRPMLAGFAIAALALAGGVSTLIG